MSKPTTNENQENGHVPGPPAFQSDLKEGWQRFLANVIENGFEIELRKPEDFIRHFPPSAIMAGLKEEPELRANIMVIATGIRPKIALKKSAASCGEDLQIALDEGEADADTVVTLLDPDDRVRFLDQKALWAYVTEGEFWNADAQKSPKAHERAAGHLAYIVGRALTDRLVSHRDIVEGIGTPKLTQLLPREELQKIIAGALEASHAGKPFSEKDLLAMTPPEVLIQHVPLAELWEQIVVPKIAEPHGFAEPKTRVPAPTPVAGGASNTEPPDDADDGLGLDVDDVLEMETKASTAVLPEGG